jgi:hypothetical protein
MWGKHTGFFCHTIKGWYFFNYIHENNRKVSLYKVYSKIRPENEITDVECGKTRLVIRNKLYLMCPGIKKIKVNTTYWQQTITIWFAPATS